MAGKKGSKQLILEYLLANIGRVVTARQLQEAAGWKAEWARDCKRHRSYDVGGSKKHGGADLGPTRAKQAWAKLGVDGHGLADEPPPYHFKGMPRLTVPMVARLQGFPDDWGFSGGKTAAYRQVGKCVSAASCPGRRGRN